MSPKNREFQPSPEEQPEEGQPIEPIEQKIERKPEEIIREFEAETELTKRRIEEIEKGIEQYKTAKEENLRMAHLVPSSINEAIDKDIARLEEKRQEFVKDVEKRGPSQEEQKIKVEIQGIDAHIKIIQKVGEQDMPGMVPETIKEGRKRDIQELEKQKKEKEEELQEETLKRIKEYQKEKSVGRPISEKEKPEEKPGEKQPEAPKKIEEIPPKPEEGKPEEAPRPVVADALDQKIEETRREVEKLKERAPEEVKEGAEKSEETAKLQELAKLEKQRQQEVERITNRNFAQETRDELVKEGHYIDKEGKKWRVRRIPKENAIKERIERIGQAERSQVFKNQWERLSDQEKAGYGNGNRIENFKNKLEEKRKTLSRQIGVEISQDIFCQFLGRYKLQEVKTTSFLGLFRKRIAIPITIKRADGTFETVMKKYSVKDFREFVGLEQKRIEENRREIAEEKWQRGQKVLAKAVAERVEKKTKEALKDIRKQESVKKFWEKVEAGPRKEKEKEEKKVRQRYQECLDKLTKWKKQFEKRKNLLSEEKKKEWEEKYGKQQIKIKGDFEIELRKIAQDFEGEVERLREKKISEILKLEELEKI